MINNLHYSRSINKYKINMYVSIFVINVLNSHVIIITNRRDLNMTRQLRTVIIP